MRLIPLVSSMLAGIGYNPDSENLVAQFQNGGKLFKYSGVPAGVFVSVITAESQGAAFTKFIKKAAYPFQQITADELDVL